MSIITSAILPHSPLLIPEIGRSNTAFLAKTQEAFDDLSRKLKDGEVESVIIISQHGEAQADSFIINVSPEMIIDFKDFGFIPPKTFLLGDALLADSIKERCRPDFPVQLISEDWLDSGSSVPLYLLKKSCPEIKTLVIHPAQGLSAAEQFNFGKKLGELLKQTEKRLAVIASGDLSHRLKKKSPGGYSPKGSRFDNKVIEFLSEGEKKTNEFLKIEERLAQEASECAFKPISLLLGIMDGQNWQTEILAYQTDFGVGYLSAELIKEPVNPSESL